MTPYFALKFCSCGKFHKMLPANYKIDGEVVFFNCTCNSTLIISAHLLIDQMTVGVDWKTKFENGDYKFGK